MVDSIYKGVVAESIGSCKFGIKSKEEFLERMKSWIEE